MNVRRKELPNTPPGTLSVPSGAVVPKRFHVIQYTPAKLVEFEADNIGEVELSGEPDTVTWININGLGNLTFLREIGRLFGFHPLILEDVLQLSSRPKVEYYDDHLYVLIRMMTYQDKLEHEQLSVLLKGNLVVTFQEREGDCLGGLRERIRRSGGQIRQMGADYLLYAIVDAVVDSYFPILEEIGDLVENLEETIVERADREILTDIHAIKRAVLGIRRGIWPLREALSSMARDGSALLSQNVQIYLRDCYDHTVQLIDLLETYRELAAGMMDLYLSTISNRMNEVMKVLTIIATVFIPLTFIAGIYGMNFDYMPELSRPWAYPAVWILMLAIGSLMMFFFYRKGWLGEPSPEMPPEDE